VLADEAFAGNLEALPDESSVMGGPSKEKNEVELRESTYGIPRGPDPRTQHPSGAPVTRNRYRDFPTRGWRLVVRIVVGVILLAITVVLVLPDLLGLDGKEFFAFFVALRPQFTAVVAVLALLLLVLWRRHWPEAVAVLVVCAIAAVIVVPRTIPHTSSASGGKTFTVLSFNVDQGGANVSKLAATIRHDKPDVVVLPESAGTFRAKLAKAIPGLGYRSSDVVGPADEDVAGVTVFSAPSLGAVKSHEINQGVFDPWLYLTGGKLGKLRVVAVHVSAPTPGKIKQWPKELASLQQWCKAGSGPVIIAGDFNATLDHKEFRDGIQGCQDSGSVTGKGLVGTWPSMWPEWFAGQIDHVLGGGGVTPKSLQVLNLPGSDHRALLAKLRVP
jgi:endonuclease/exonuclease/phosphatase (EEP) superfamily protein YafD